jgi:formylglycine-generating enzyme required for sulfatase activity/serine/threonine protein kinase
MTDQRDVKDVSLPLPALERIDRVCLEFEAAWKTGAPPRIESLLVDTPEPERSALLRELLLLDLDYRSRGGQTPAPEEYQARFPDDSELLADVFRQSRRGGSSGERRVREKPPRKEITLEEFVQTLGQSGLMSVDEVRAFVDDLPPDKKPADARDLAREMVRQGKLTKFQAQAVYQRKTRGLVLGNYVVLDRIGRGGMGQVYKAHHQRLDRVVALKILPSASKKSEEAIGRFHREARAIARLAHPNIVTVHDADEADGVHFFVMEYAAGSDLFALVDKHGPLSVGDAVDYVLQAAEALEYAHDRGIVHRDVKPANLLLEPGGTVKVLDMGLARLDESLGADEAAKETVRQEGGQATVPDDQGLTRTGELLGTIDYMAPEQASDSRSVDHRADVYGLGCTLHYLLTGRPVYPRETLLEKMLAHREEPIPSLRDARPDVPEGVDDVFRRMIAKEPEARCPSMSQVLAALRACLPIEEDQGAGPRRPPPLSARPIEAASDSNAGSKPAGSDSLALVALDDADLNQSIRLPPVAAPPASEHAPAAEPERPERRMLIAWLLVGAALLVILLAIAVLIRLKRDGTLVVTIPKAGVWVEIFDTEGKRVVRLQSRKDGVTVKLSPGDYRVRVKEEDCPPYEETVTIVAGGEKRLQPPLPPPPPPDGTLVVEISEPGASVEVFDEQGERVVDLQSEEGAVTAKVPSRDYRLRVEKDGFLPFEQGIKIVSGGKTPVRVELLALGGEPIPPGPWVDLLERVDLARSCLRGFWRREENGLIAVGDRCQLLLPLVIQGDYDLEIQYTPVRGGNAVQVTFPVGSRRCELELSGGGANVDGLALIDGLPAWDEKNPTRKRSPIVNGQRYQVQIRVRLSGDEADVDVSIDGKPHIHWAGKQASLEGRPELWRGLDTFRPGMAAWAAHPVIFHNARMRTVEAEAFWLQPDAPPLPDWAGAEEVTFTAPDHSHGLRLISSFTDGPVSVEQIDGRPVIRPENLYLYFQVGEWFAYDVPADSGQPTVVELTLLDLGAGWIDIEYDGHAKEYAPGYAPSMKHQLTGSGEPATVRFELPDARFANRQNGWCDFRVRRSGPLDAKIFALEKIAVRRVPAEKAEPPAPAAGRQTDEAAPTQDKSIEAADEEDRELPPVDAPKHGAAIKPAVVDRHAMNRRPGDIIENSLGMRFAFIPAGEFMMGSTEQEIAAVRKESHAQDPKWFVAEGPQHKVRITKPFFLSVHEVTQADYQRVMGSNPSSFSLRSDGKSELMADVVEAMDRLPVEEVSWWDAVEFCRKLSVLEGLRPHRCEILGDPKATSRRLIWHDGDGYRLPTEAEWEYACRAGTTGPFHFGNRPSSTKANWANRLKRTTTVGSYPPNDWGLYDMHGNVAEWCRDVYAEDYYRRSPVADPTGPSHLVKQGHGMVPVFRGGAWSMDTLRCRSSARFGGYESRFHSSISGFRVALDATGFPADPPSARQAP